MATTWKSKYFTLEEMTASATAKRMGISNKPTPDIVAALQRLVTNVLDPLREEWGAPIIVTSGYRSHLPYDQLIDEYNSDWLHVSHRAAGNRLQLLSAHRIKGKTVYTKGVK